MEFTNVRKQHGGESVRNMRQTRYIYLTFHHLRISYHIEAYVIHIQSVSNWKKHPHLTEWYGRFVNGIRCEHCAIVAKEHFAVTLFVSIRSFAYSLSRKFPLMSIAYGSTTNSDNIFNTLESQRDSVDAICVFIYVYPRSRAPPIRTFYLVSSAVQSE